MGILPLHIETGRYQNKSLEDRTCEVCNTNVIEDEVHFVCKCPIYDHLRAELFNSLNIAHLSDVEKLIYLVKFHWKKLAVFLEKAWFIRKSLLYSP
jgi:hypothetical protein